MIKFEVRLMTVAVLLVIAMLLGGHTARWYFTKPGPLATETTLIIPRGEESLAIGKQLQAAGVVSSSYAFAIAAHLPKHPALKAGEYLFVPRATLASVIEELQTGKVVVHHITIPEGLTSLQILQVLQADPILQGDIATVPDEGSLLPETYNFALGETRAGLIVRMQQDAAKALASAWATRDRKTVLQTPNEALVLASIIEKETGKATERQLIAAVFSNRLKQGMKLQSDPTVIYALTKGTGPLDRALTHDDLAIESPYNTYEYGGLPPGPICNPGKPAMEAAVHPAPFPYLYFVASGNGGHNFAQTLDQHNRNVAQWLKTLHDRAP